MEEKKERTWQRRKGRKGFTLIELIVVMAVMAVLVLLAAPKFLGHTKEAQFTKHINNAKVLEDASERYYIDHGKWPRGADADKYTPAEVASYADKIYDITGTEMALAEGDYWDMDYAALSSYAKLPDESERANYVLRNPVGKVYYLDGLTEAGATRVTASNEATPEVPKELTPEEINALPHDEWVESLEAKGYVMATDADFTRDTVGNWRYTGTDDYVIVPHEINGVPVTSYKFMFSGYAGYGVLSNAVKGVASNSPNVTDMRNMFRDSQATSLDLSSFDTSNVTDMRYMFFNSQATSLDLSSFDTSNVTDMGYMFYGSKATTLDLSSFNTANVTTMVSMFNGSKATTLDLSSFNTANVTDMGYMFSFSKAATLDLHSFDLRNIVTGTSSTTSKNWHMFSNAAARTGYARTTADRDKLNDTYAVRPSGLTFIVK